MKHLLRALSAIALLCSIGTTHAQGTLPFALSQQQSVNGSPLAGALLYTYVTGTVAQPQNTFADTALTITNPWPLQADQSGRLPMFYLANGTVHVRLTDSAGSVQYDNPSVLVIGASSGAGGTALDPTTLYTTGDIKVRYGTGPISGFVRANGLTIGNTTSGYTEPGCGGNACQNLFIYLYGADPNLVVSGGRTGNALNDFNSGKVLTLPDWRGKVITALSDMGNSAWSGFTSTYAGCTPTTLGAACGSQTSALATTNLPAINYTPSGTNSASGVTVSSVTVNGATSVMRQGSANGFPGGVGFAFDNITLTSTGTGSGTANAQTFTGNAANLGGSATPFANVAPAVLATIYLKL